jgi:predicted PurR-regulated permease PerM
MDAAGVSPLDREMALDWWHGRAGREAGGNINRRAAAFLFVLLGTFLAVAILLQRAAPPEIQQFSSFEDLSVQQCKLNEDQIRQLWQRSALHSQNEAERIAITASWVKATADLCISGLNAKPKPLPVELQRLAR